MVDDEELEALWDAKYAERGIPTDWQEITPETMASAFRLYYRGLRSAGPNHDKSPEAEALIHNPIKALRAQGFEVDDDARVSTMIVNHEKTLERFIIYATVLISTNPRTVGITLIKEEMTEEQLLAEHEADGEGEGE